MKGTWWLLGALTLGCLAVPLVSATQVYGDDRHGRDRRYGDDGYGDDRYGRDDRYGDGRYDDSRYGRYDRRYGYGNTQGIGYERGFRDGSKHGLRDVRSRRGFNYRHDNNYWEADNGYRSSYGPRHEYASGYREGYRAGYEEAFATRGYGHGRRRYDERYDPRYRDQDDDRTIYEVPRRW